MTLLRSLIQGVKYNYLITSRPTTNSFDDYIKLLQKYNVSVVVRVCESYYDTTMLNDYDIKIYDINISDGCVPTFDNINMWISILNQLDIGSTIAIHCVAGLGRAPTMVVLSLIIIDKMNNMGAIELIRSQIKGSLNNKQLQFLYSYKVERLTKCCVIM